MNIASTIYKRQSLSFGLAVEGTAFFVHFNDCADGFVGPALLGTMATGCNNVGECHDQFVPERACGALGAPTGPGAHRVSGAVKSAWSEECVER